MSQNSYTYDSATLLKDAGVIGASAAATVGGSAKAIYVGPAFVEGVAIADITAIETDTGNEIYTLVMQGSADEAFTAPVQLASYAPGHTSVIPGGGATTTVGRHFVRFSNEQDGVIYPWLRIYTVVAGTIAGGGGINYSCWIGDTKSSS